MTTPVPWNDQGPDDTRRRGTLRVRVLTTSFAAATHTSGTTVAASSPGSTAGTSSTSSSTSGFGTSSG